jgi:hypothetical protein
VIPALRAPRITTVRCRFTRFNKVRIVTVNPNGSSSSRSLTPELAVLPAHSREKAALRRSLPPRPKAPSPACRGHASLAMPARILADHRHVPAAYGIEIVPRGIGNCLGRRGQEPRHKPLANEADLRIPAKRSKPKPDDRPSRQASVTTSVRMATIDVSRPSEPSTASVRGAASAYREIGAFLSRTSTIRTWGSSD